MTVDEALEHADKRLDSDCRTLAAEVRRLRAMLELTPDALELAKEIVDYVSEEEYGAIAFAAQLITAYRARLLDEAAERAMAWWYSGDASAKRGDDPELDKLADELSAAVRGEVE